ncbi:MAG TPA: hypothetical protein VH592_06040 [Gemmataceae bacterium]|jgi:hypothetical protein
MKPSQWIAALVLALMVGGITFVSVYLGGSRPPEGTETINEPPPLNFPFKLFPREDEKAQTTEVGQVGYQDYWFVNEGDQTLVGLNGKGCTCSEVDITMAPPSWMPYLARSAAFQALQQPPRGLDNLVNLAVAIDRAHQFPELPDTEGTMLSREFSAKVPAGAIGRVRLSWRQHEVKPLRTYADLWIGKMGGPVSARLETGVRIATPLEVNKELTIESVTERELEKMDAQNPERGRRGRNWIICFSLTRPYFRLKAEVMHDRPEEANSDPVEVGEPVPLAPEILRRLEEKQEAMHRLTAMWGYRVPVTVRPRAKDGTPMEWGRFHRTVQLSSPDPGIEPVQIQVMGEVVGDISVGVGDEAGAINLGPFPQSRGTHRSINLETDEKAIDLELDLKRKPKYLNVTLSEPQDTGSHRSWVLRVEVPPGAAQGEFPRADNPVYRDSAIYVKTKGGKSGTSLRSIRIPVHGVANQG